MIDLDTFKHLAGIDLGAPAPKPTSFEGDQREAARTLWTSPDGSVEIGVWECTPGRFTADRSTTSEMCHIISGRVEMTTLDGETRDLGAGDLLVLPVGWRGTWRIVETTRKLYIMHQAPAA
ncbi:cupin domain-containing protein [Chthonobacter rhizosphaerae]|uniref:cupin domain-containing protein n=1 Tax=Chthonobacter rhizosphaerae TaxID=2735553 RepID=UPI0015EE6D15|nr:cupin domain-containing protein [Chthonobacter rhizosphaerae]